MCVCVCMYIYINMKTDGKKTTATTIKKKRKPKKKTHLSGTFPFWCSYHHERQGMLRVPGEAMATVPPPRLQDVFQFKPWVPQGLMAALGRERRWRRKAGCLVSLCSYVCGTLMMAALGRFQSTSS